MHYFFGLEVWQSPEGIFLNQGKYVVEILEIFDMLDCKSMATPMETNMNLFFDESSGLVDMTQYIQTYYWVIDVSDKYKARYMLYYEHLESVSS